MCVCLGIGGCTALTNLHPKFKPQAAQNPATNQWVAGFDRGEQLGFESGVACALVLQRRGSNYDTVGEWIAACRQLDRQPAEQANPETNSVEPDARYVAAVVTNVTTTNELAWYGTNYYYGVGVCNEVWLELELKDKDVGLCATNVLLRVSHEPVVGVTNDAQYPWRIEFKQ